VSRGKAAALATQPGGENRAAGCETGLLRTSTRHRFPEHGGTVEGRRTQNHFHACQTAFSPSGEVYPLQRADKRSLGKQSRNFDLPARGAFQ